MLAISDYYKYSLDEIFKESNVDVRNEILKLRNKELEYLGKSYIERSIIKKYSHLSVEDISILLEQKLYEITSTSLFPNQIVLCYPRFSEEKATRDYTCDISGATIKKGSYHINYNMFMDNISDGHAYILARNWISELGYRDFYPRSISELDILNNKLEHPFNNLGEPYNYYDISIRKGNYIKVRRLGR